LLNEPNKS